MTTTASNVLVGVTGSVNVAPLLTALPTDPTSGMNVAFLEVGYISEDGVTETIDDSIVELKAWQNSEVVRRIQDDHSYQVAFEMIETNAVSLKQFYGTYAAGVAKVAAGVLPRQSWILNFIDGTNKKRIVIPDGQIVARGDVVNKNGEVIGYPVTIEAYTDAAGFKAYIYLATSAVSA